MGDIGEKIKYNKKFSVYISKNIFKKIFRKDTEDTDVPLLMILIEKVIKETHFSVSSFVNGKDRYEVAEKQAHPKDQ